MAKQSTQNASRKYRSRKLYRRAIKLEQRGLSEHIEEALALRGWSEIFHFPTSILLFYFPGLVFFHFANPAMPPLWMEIGFFVVELSIIRISHLFGRYIQKYLAHTLLSFLYIASLLLFIQPWINHWLFTNNPLLPSLIWEFRGLGVTSTLVLFLMLLLISLKWEIKRRKEYKCLLRKLGKF